MQIDIVKVAEIIGACSVILGVIIGGYKLYDKLIDRVDELEKRVDSIEKKHEKDISRIKKENAIIIRALQGILDGQMQQGCNGECKNAKKEIDDFLNKSAHD